MQGAIHPVRIEEAKALSDELRIMILELLRQKPMGVLEIAAELRKRGVYKTPNTIRYHLSLLKDAGLIDLRRVGRQLKYATVDTYYAYTAEGELEVLKAIDEIASLIEEDLERVIRKLMEIKGDELREIAESLKPCAFCITRHFMEHVVFEVIKRSTGRALARVQVGLKE